MNIFKIKNTRFCTFIITFIIILIVALPFSVILLKFLDLEIRLGICLILLFVSVFILIKFSESAIGAELMLKMIEAKNKQRTEFVLPEGITKEKIESNVRKIGAPVEPALFLPQPQILNYSFKTPLTGFSSGIETVVSFYKTQFLGEAEYKNILNSVQTNSKNLKGRKKSHFLDSEQKKAPLKRTVIALIFADSVEEKMSGNLYNIIVKEDKDGVDESVLPCVINFKDNTVFFNTAIIPDMFSLKPSRNRGIKIIKNEIFKGKLDFKNNPNRIEFNTDEIDVEQTLFKLIASERKEFKNIEKREKTNRKIFKKMNDKEILQKGNNLYIKLGDKGVCLYVESDAENKLATIEFFYMWDFPKTNQISKKTIKEIQSMAINYFSQQGYITKFSSLEDE